MYCPKCDAPLAEQWEQCGMCGRQKTKDKTAVWTKGDDYIDGDYFTAGISIGEHTNAIECYAPTEEMAAALRDKVLRQNI